MTWPEYANVTHGCSNAATALVLEIRLPENADDDLPAALLSLWPSYLAYVLSFGIIGLNWVTHHRKFRYITAFDGRLITINLVFLLVVAFVPFPTSVMAEHGDQTAAVVLYASTVSALSLLQLWIWVHAHRGGLMAKDVDEGLYRYVRANLLPVPLVFLATIPVALFGPGWTSLLWILIWPVSRIVNAIAIRRIDASAGPASPRAPRRSRG